MLSRIVPVNKNGSCSTTPIWLRKERCVTSRTSCPSICPLFYVIETCQEPGNSAFPGPGRSNDSYSLAGLHTQIEVVQYRQITTITECNVAELYFAAYLWQLFSACLVDYINRHLQDLKDTFRSHTCTLQLRILLANVADRVKKTVDVKCERDQYAYFEHALRYQRTPI